MLSTSKHRMRITFCLCRTYFWRLGMIYNQLWNEDTYASISSILNVDTQTGEILRLWQEKLIISKMDGMWIHPSTQYTKRSESLQIDYSLNESQWIQTVLYRTHYGSFLSQQTTHPISNISSTVAAQIWHRLSYSGFDIRKIKWWVTAGD